MCHVRRLALLLPLLTVSPAVAADWKPLQAPLMTKWARDVDPAKPHPEYPRPQLVRKDWLNLNGLWDYAIRPKDQAVGDAFDGQILVPFPAESALSGVMKPVGPDNRLWYRRTFEVPKDWKGRHVLLHFGAVDWEATVRVNGKEVGSHKGGYDPFTLDVTDALKPEGKQEVVVGVWDPSDAGPQPAGKQRRKPGGIWYTPTTGIWQTVWLEPVNAGGWIDHLTINTDIDRNEVTVGCRLSKNLGTPGFRIEVLDGEKVIAEAGRLEREAALEYTYTIKVPDAKHWTPERPHLYGLRVHVSGQGRVDRSDQVESYFGMRKTSVGKDPKGVTRLLLNNEPVFQFGPLDQGFWPDGLYTAPTDAALRYDIEMTKKLGFNMARKHVKVEPDRWYYWCDKLGLLVWQDMPSGDAHVGPGKGEIKRTKESAEIYERELKAMIDARRNHPCIVAWVPFNEGWGQFDTVRITEWVKKHDPSRVVICASGWNDFPAGDAHDIHVYPGPGAPKPEEKRAAVLGEFGGLGLPLKGHTWQDEKNWGYRTFTTKEDLTDAYLDLMERLHPLIENGLSAAVYTQTTDVEVEVNGLMTYDRAVLKVPLEEVARAHKRLWGPAPKRRTLVPTSKEQGQEWRYTTTRPPEGWFRPDFDDSDWKKGQGGFGTAGTPGAVVRTEWKTEDIWIRRSVDVAELKDGANLRLLMHHDDDAEVYVNGVLAAKLSGYVTDYRTVRLRPEAVAALKPGKNVVAVHCHQIKGGQYIDVGLEMLEEK
jgi:hypothetical protein